MPRLFTTLLLLVAAFSLQAQPPSLEEAAIKNTIKSAYVDGLFNKGDTLAIRKGFHPTFRLLGQQAEGEMRVLDIETWIGSVREGLEKGRYPRKADKRVSVIFQEIDIVENVASVKLDFLVGGEKRYVDFIQLYRFKEGWKIVHKVYHTLPVAEK